MIKITYVILALAVGLFVRSIVEAQGTFYVSNLGATSSVGNKVGSDSWLAELFQTGTDSDGYVLNSVQLLMNTASGSPSGFTVSIYSLDNGVFQPGSSLGTLVGSDPADGGTFNYTASDITLLPSTFYWIVVTSATPIALGSYYWSLADTGSYSSSPGWRMGSYSSSSNGSSWVENRSNPLQFAAYATPVPEPSTYALMAMGLVVLGCWQYKRVITRQNNS